MSTMLNQQRDQSGGGVGSGVSDEDVKSMSLRDLMKQQETGEPDAPEILPYQLNFITDMLGDIFTKVMDVKQKVGSLKNHPDFDSTHAKKVSEIHNKLDEVNGIIAKDVTGIIDSLGLKTEEDSIE